LDWEWNVSEGLTGQEDRSETATGNEEFRLNVHLGLLLVVDESVDTSGEEEAEEVLEKRGSETKAESLVSTLRSVLSGIVKAEQSFHDEAEVDIGEIDTSDSNDEFNWG